MSLNVIDINAINLQKSLLPAYSIPIKSKSNIIFSQYSYNYGVFNNSIIVQVKRYFVLEMFRFGIKGFEESIKLMSINNSIVRQSDYLVGILGILIDNKLNARPFVSTVIPISSLGSLNQILSLNNLDTSISLNPNVKIGIIFDISEGIKYLHENHIIHGFLTPESILVYDNYRAKITDFGYYSNLLLDSKITIWTNELIRFSSPEILKCKDSLNIKNLSYPTDIYSFGCIIITILTNKLPYYNIDHDDAIISNILEGKLPYLSTDYSNRSMYVTNTEYNIENIMTSCLSNDAISRPNANDLNDHIKRCYITIDRNKKLLDKVKRDVKIAEIKEEINTYNTHISEHQAIIKHGQILISNKENELVKFYKVDEKMKAQQSIRQAKEKLAAIEEELIGLQEDCKHASDDLAELESRQFKLVTILQSGDEAILNDRKRANIDYQSNETLRNHFKDRDIDFIKSLLKPDSNCDQIYYNLVNGLVVNKISKIVNYLSEVIDSRIFFEDQQYVDSHNIYQDKTIESLSTRSIDSDELESKPTHKSVKSHPYSNKSSDRMKLTPNNKSTITSRAVDSDDEVEEKPLNYRTGKSVINNRANSCKIDSDDEYDTENKSSITKNHYCNKHLMDSDIAIYNSSNNMSANKTPQYAKKITNNAKTFIDSDDEIDIMHRSSYTDKISKSTRTNQQFVDSDDEIDTIIATNRPFDITSNTRNKRGSNRLDSGATVNDINTTRQVSYSKNNSTPDSDDEIIIQNNNPFLNNLNHLSFNNKLVDSDDENYVNSHSISTFTKSNTSSNIEFDSDDEYIVNSSNKSNVFSGKSKKTGNKVVDMLEGDSEDELDDDFQDNNEYPGYKKNYATRISYIVNTQPTIANKQLIQAAENLRNKTINQSIFRQSDFRLSQITSFRPSIIPNGAIRQSALDGYSYRPSNLPNNQPFNDITNDNSRMSILDRELTPWEQLEVEYLAASRGTWDEALGMKVCGLGFDNDYLTSLIEKEITPAHLACITGSFHVFIYLIEVIGFDPVAVDDKGRQCLHYACKHGHLNIVKYLFEKFEIESNILINDNFNISSVLYTIIFGHINILHYLLEPPLNRVVNKNTLDNEFGATLLHWACICNQIHMVEYLIDTHYVDIEVRAKCDNNTPILWACYGGSLEIVQFLYHRSAKIHPKYLYNGLTCLHLSTLSGSIKKTKYLIEDLGFNVTEINDDNCTPFDIATGKCLEYLKARKEKGFLTGSVVQKK